VVVFVSVAAVDHYEGIEVIKREKVLCESEE